MMSRPLSFLRPYLYQSARPCRPDHARAYLSVQRRFAQSIAVDGYTGPHDVEKQKRLEQLRRVKPLDDYHPRLRHTHGAETLSLGDFNARYREISDSRPDVVSVFGTSSLEVLPSRRLQRQEEFALCGHLAPS
jgi:lysyl-tRNA synthetase class 2